MLKFLCIPIASVDIPMTTVQSNTIFIKYVYMCGCVYLMLNTLYATEGMHAYHLSINDKNISKYKRY